MANLDVYAAMVTTRQHAIHKFLGRRTRLGDWQGGVGVRQAALPTSRQQDGFLERSDRTRVLRVMA